MLPLNKTFRILSRRDIERLHDGLPAQSLELADLDRMTGSPFDNPARTTPNWASAERPSAADIDLLRAAYFATFPAVD